MNNTIIIFIITLIIPLSSLAQTVKDNLEKYWYLRQRLEDHFIVISPNDEAGTNIPANTVHKNGIMNWHDGNSGMQYYIGMLATEYRLLKDNGLDYQNTLQKLDYAIKAVERLDYTAETYWDGEPCMNGYFIRDDVHSTFDDTAVIKGLNENFAGRIIDATFTHFEPALDNSQDNVWHYLLNFALVVKLVDDIDIKNRVKKLAGDMVNHMHSYDWSWTFSSQNKITYVCYNFGETHFWDIIPAGENTHQHWFDAWVLRNPVNHGLSHAWQVWEQPPSHVGRQWGFAEAAHWITGQDHHYASSENDKFEINILANNASEEGNYSFKALFTVIGYYWQYINTRFDPGNPHHEHFPLIWQILHEDVDLGDFKPAYDNLLNSCPECGPFYYKENGIITYPPQWGFQNRLISDPGEPGELRITGDLCGIDYMLLNNLYWLVYFPAKFIDTDYPIGTSGTISEPAVITANTITANNTIHPSCDVTYQANAKIILKPGFKVEYPTRFKAIVDGPGPVYNTTASAPVCDPIAPDSQKSTSNRTYSYDGNKLTEDSQFKNNKDEFTAKIYPNPTNNELMIILSKNFTDKIRIEIVDISGQILYSEINYGNSLILDISKIGKGIYYLRIISGENTIIERIVIQ